VRSTAVVPRPIAALLAATFVFLVLPRLSRAVDSPDVDLIGTALLATMVVLFDLIALGYLAWTALQIGGDPARSRVIKAILWIAVIPCAIQTAIACISFLLFMAVIISGKGIVG
jgi:hypothetical protein